MHKLSLPIAAVIGMTLATGSLAFADELFFLTVPENGCSPCAPGGTVGVDVNLLTTGAGTSTATVTFMGETVGGLAYVLYDTFLEVNGNFGVSSYIVTGGSAAGTYTNPGKTPGSLDLYGTFNESSMVVHSATSVEFFLNLGTWTSAANVLTTTALPNGNAGHYAQPFDAAAQVRVAACTSTTQPGCAGVTTGHEGAIMDSAGFEPTVPEPSSVFLFGSAALLAAGALRKKLVR